MIAFRVSLNGEHLCTAGVRRFGVLSAIVTWVRRKPENRRHAKSMEEELSAEIGGLDSTSKEHLEWLSRRLLVGDRVSIDVVETRTTDKPQRRYRDDAKAVQRAKRRYVEHLKKELGASAEGRTSNKPVQPTPATKPIRKRAGRVVDPRG